MEREDMGSGSGSAGQPHEGRQVLDDRKNLNRSLCEIIIDSELGDMETLLAARALIEQGASPDARHESYRARALFAAIHAGKQATAMELVAAGAKIQEFAQAGRESTLAQALGAGMLDLALMLAPMTDLSQRNEAGQQPWMLGLGALSSKEDLVPFLPSGPHDQKDLDQALLMAMEGRPASAELAVEILVSMGASPSAANKRGLSAAMQAINHGNEEAALALIDAGADVGAVDSSGDTAFSWAAIRASEPLLRRLAPLSDQNQRHVDGRTPLMQAIEYYCGGEKADAGMAFLFSVSNLDARVDREAARHSFMNTNNKTISLWQFATAMAGSSRALELLRNALDAKAACDEAREIALSAAKSPARGKALSL